MDSTLSIVREEVRAHNDAVMAGAPVAVKAEKKFSPYELFKKKYRLQPKAFIHECIKWRDDKDEKPTAYQDEIFDSLIPKKRVAVRGPHGLGKTTTAALLIIWFALTRDGEDWKCLTTASAWRQLTKFLWPEIWKWVRRIDWDKVGRKPFNDRTELLQLSLKLETGEAFALASDNYTSIEGAHADCLLYIFDEGKAIPETTFDAAEGAFMGSEAAEAYALVISTPGEPVGRFYDIHKRKPGYEDWWARHVTLEEAIAAGRIDRAKANQRMKQWGEKTSLYQNRVLGEFWANDEEGVIPLAWVELANERWRLWHENGRELGNFRAVGVDVGGGGGAKADFTVIARRFDSPFTDKENGYTKTLKLIPYLERNNNEDTMQTTGRVAGILKKYGGRAVVDVNGIGAGVVSRLRELEIPSAEVVGFMASESSDMTDMSGEMGFKNKRTAAWWNFREMLDPSNNHEVAIPPDDGLTGDLTAPHKKPESGGRLRMETKKEIAERIGRSTDDGDAVVQAFFEEANKFLFA